MAKQPGNLSTKGASRQPSEFFQVVTCICAPLPDLAVEARSKDATSSCWPYY